MSESELQLTQKLDFKHPENRASLPRTKQEAWQAAENREQVARAAYESAELVDKTLDHQGATMTVELGKTKDGKPLSGSIEKFNASRFLRVKLLTDGKPEASFVYEGLDFSDGSSPSMFVTEEVPTATGPKVKHINRDPGGLDYRGLPMARGLGHNIVYRGGDTVGDMGAMDFGATAQVLAVAAENIRAEQAQERAA